MEIALKRVLPSIVAALALALFASWAGAQPPPRRAQATFTPTHPADIILGRPTGTSIVLSVLCDGDAKALVACGTEKAGLAARTEAVTFKKGEPREVLLDKLKPDARYYYQLQDAATGKPLVEGSFHTQRPPGGAFTFEVQGDSHPERPNEHDPALYARTLRAAAADGPDFYVCMGDDFSVDNLRAVNVDTVTDRYRLQRPFLGLVGQSSPIFLVNGNHEQAAGCNLDGTANNVAVWAQTARNSFFPMPGPDGFYTGDATPVKFIGLLRDYYAWTWGDALFVVIDPYWHSPNAVDTVFGGGLKARDGWSITLGDEQYRWLKQTLETSRAKFKFVFAHHVLGTGRGGIENAGLFEWGGKDRRGVSEFAQKRPGWELPIHQLMAKNDVTLFFQGHDHIFARQQLDGVVYQTCPEPADPSYAFSKWKSDYATGDLLPNSGRVRVAVAPDKVAVEYVRSWLAKDEKVPHKDGEVAFRYEIAAKGQAAGTFALRSPDVVDGGPLPKDYTGDGTRSTLPLEWSGAPEGTKSFALIMHHIPGPGDVKWYWILYDIPADVKALPKNVKGVGTLGNNSVNGRTEYAPPHSKGPGPKTYIYTVYALSAPPKLVVPPAEVSRQVLLDAMKGLILGSADLRVVYTRFPAPDGEGGPKGEPPPPPPPPPDRQ